MGFSIMDRYKIVDGDASTAQEVAKQLQSATEKLWYRKDLMWAFPYVYCFVTKEIIKQAAGGTFRSSGLTLRWIANFYEFYVLNLNSFLKTGVAEDPWMTAFLEPRRLRPDQPWGARSAAAFVLGMFAHIKSDLPRAIAFIYLKFYSPDSRRPPGVTGSSMPGANYDDGKVDFDNMNQKVFPAVIDQVAASRTDIIPSISTVLPDGFRDGLLGFFAGGRAVYKESLPKEREAAWQVGKLYTQDARVQDTATKIPVSRTITPVSL